MKEEWLVASVEVGATVHDPDVDNEGFVQPRNQAVTLNLWSDGSVTWEKS